MNYLLLIHVEFNINYNNKKWPEAGAETTACPTATVAQTDRVYPLLRPEGEIKKILYGGGNGTPAPAQHNGGALPASRSCFPMN